MPWTVRVAYLRCRREELHGILKKNTCPGLSLSPALAIQSLSIIPPQCYKAINLASNLRLSLNSLNPGKPCELRSMFVGFKHQKSYWRLVGSKGICYAQIIFSYSLLRTSHRAENARRQPREPHLRGRRSVFVLRTQQHSAEKAGRFSADYWRRGS